MALFTDELVTQVSDLLAYESNLGEISAAEGIDLDIKIHLAHTEVGAKLDAASRRPGNVFFPGGGGRTLGTGGATQGRFELNEVVVTPPLKLTHTFQTLSIVYRDAYNRKLNDKYLPKWREYKELARWAWDLLAQTGIGVSSAPIPRAKAPALDWVSSMLTLVPLFVSMTWVGPQGAEGAGSAEQAIAIPPGNTLRVMPAAGSESAVGWNVYVGESSGSLTRQNAAPIAVGATWTLPASGLVAGEELGAGQAPDLFKTAPRFSQRG